MGKKLARKDATAPIGAAPFSLLQLEARLYKNVTVTTSEKDDGVPYPELKGQWVFRDEAGEKFLWSPRPYRFEHHPVDTPSEADYIMFLCPVCFAKNGGAKGTHSVMVSFAGRNVPDDAGSVDADGKPSRWNVSGTSLDNLVLTPSILLDAKRKAEEGCHWHGFVGSSGILPGHAG